MKRIEYEHIHVGDKVKVEHAPGRPWGERTSTLMWGPGIAFEAGAKYWLIHRPGAVVVSETAMGELAMAFLVSESPPGTLKERLADLRRAVDTFMQSAGKQ